MRLPGCTLQFSSFCRDLFDESKDAEMRALLLDAMLIADDDQLQFFVALALLVTRRTALLAMRQSLVERAANVGQLLHATLAVQSRAELATLLRSAAGVCCLFCLLFAIDNAID